MILWAPDQRRGGDKAHCPPLLSAPPPPLSRTAPCRRYSAGGGTPTGTPSRTSEGKGTKPSTIRELSAPEVFELSTDSKSKLTDLRPERRPAQVVLSRNAKVTELFVWCYLFRRTQYVHAFLIVVKRVKLVFGSFHYGIPWERNNKIANQTGRIELCHSRLKIESFRPHQ
jgi:hypothetical protein